MSRIKPFVKWAGGKNQLLHEIRKKYPARVEKYCEPFVGGGAVLFDVLQSFKPEEVLINDINQELINTYMQIKEQPLPLLKLLSDLQQKYYLLNESEKKEMFYAKRDNFNSLVCGASHNSDCEKAALFIFLNKTCFNGLYRVNSKGLFNVPWNKANKPLICDSENIKNCSALLRKVKITAKDYTTCKDFIDENTFVYIDPPYRPLSQTSSFTAYSKDQFTDTQQVELGGFITDIAQRGVTILASNSDPKNTDQNDDFFDNLYSNFDIKRIQAIRAINSNGQQRSAINELLISNTAKIF